MEETIQKETKLCARCKKELPFSDFHRCISNPDGFQSYCKECQRQAARKRRLKPTDNKVPDPALADFDSRTLIEELRARGYKGKLTYVVQKTVVV